jgi:hypothetical protein
MFQKPRLLRYGVSAPFAVPNWRHAVPGYLSGAASGRLRAKSRLVPEIMLWVRDLSVPCRDSRASLLLGCRKQQNRRVGGGTSLEATDGGGAYWAF